MPAPSGTSWLRSTLRTLSLLMTATLCTTLLVAIGARPAAAEIPPTDPCYSALLGVGETEFLADDPDHYVEWVCSKSNTTPIIYYWKPSVHSLDALEETKSAAKGALKSAGLHVIKSGLWSASLQSSFGVFFQSGMTDWVGSFELYDWSSHEIKRDMGVRLLAEHSTDGGATWHACRDGWNYASSPTSRFSYEFPKPTSDCGGTIKLMVQAQFFSLTSQSWVTTPFVTAGPYTIPAV